MSERAVRRLIVPIITGYAVTAVAVVYFAAMLSLTEQVDVATVIQVVMLSGPFGSYVGIIISAR